jgi:transposase
MGSGELFGEQRDARGPGAQRPVAVAPAGAPRVIEADRSQLELRPVDLDGLIPAGHRARAIWQFVEGLDLSAFYAPIKARGSQPGRSPSDPKVLLALWVYALSNGVGHARELERLCHAHDGYRWLRGGVPVNYHTLSDFRWRHRRAVDELLSTVLAVLLHQGVITLRRVAQDGVRVRASAGTNSFRRQRRLEEWLEAARAHLNALRRAAGDPGRSARQQAAQERAARGRAARVEQALKELATVQTLRAAQRGGKKSRGEARASATDPEARVLRMSDGGFRPAYNVQFATTTEGQAIVGVHVSNTHDSGQLAPTLADIERRTGQRPAEYLADAGFAEVASVEATAAQGVTLYTPVPERHHVDDPHAPRPGDSAAVVAWRARMGTAAAQEIYRERAPTAERVNADLKTWRGLGQVPLRGTQKVLAFALLNALTFNILRALALGIHL